MYSLVEKRLERLIRSGQQATLKGGGIGLEKECLRVDPSGKIAQTPHPEVLGSALTHPYITTDYSEALIEFITPPCGDMSAALDFLRDTQQFVYRHINPDELLWATSMPCVIAGDAGIPIAQYGCSNVGMMKHIYRRGLGYRYGRVMQAIAGVHFNYSLPEAFWPALQELEQDKRAAQDFISDYYFRLTRNLQRFGWLIFYLFGASPAVCKSFLGGQPTDLLSFDADTYYGPYATTLRMGDIGYSNKKESEAGIKACYDSLADYVACLSRATETPHPAYERIGVVVDGVYRQLNTHILQIENEYYSTVRPKQPPINNEKPALALQKRGVQYVELRSLDVNAFHPVGVSAEQLRFLEALMVFCVLHDSPPIGSRERDEVDMNENVTAQRGRDPKLRLQRQGRRIGLQAWASEVLDAMQGVCELLDADEPGQPYSQTLALQRAAAQDFERTPSARVLAEMRAHGEGFYRFAKRLSHQHLDYFLSLPVGHGLEACYAQRAERSLRDQREIEAGDDISFEEYLRRYYAQS